MRVLIIGGYGAFGARLAELLSEQGEVDLIIAGRSRDKAQALCARLPRAEAAVFDRDADVEAQARALAPDLIVDASGPWQAYGDDPYRVIKAAIALKRPYLDLADGAAFVDGVGGFDAAARAAGVFVLSGVSTCPALTAAAVDRLTEDMEGVDLIEGGIAPSPHAVMGENVVRAIASYAGKPVQLWRRGAPASAPGLVGARRRILAAPGVPPLPALDFVLADTPDLRALPARYPGVKNVWFGVATRPQIWRRLLSLLARLVAAGVIPGLTRLSGLFHKVASKLRWGAHRGGMFVRVEGRRNGRPVDRTWTLIADGDDGPYIPSMAVAAVVRRMMAGRSPEPGARAAAGALSLDDFAPFFAARKMSTGVNENLSLYRRVLGSEWEKLPPALQAGHDATGGSRMEGLAEVERGSGLLARMLGAIYGFPPAGADVPVTVNFTPIPGGELWTRDFGGRRFSSRQTEGRGRWRGLVREAFGPIAVGLENTVQGGVMEIRVRRCAVLGVPAPLFLAPSGGGREFVDDQGRFRFDVRIAHPLAGLIVAYRGWLEPAS